MSIRHFRIFIAVAEEENITKAAKKLYLTQPTVSVAIKEIEEHYGARFLRELIRDFILQKKERDFSTMQSISLRCMMRWKLHLKIQTLPEDSE